ncbi:S-methyl-5-thioribose-1-phosphate isomerase [Planctomycetota bacterium]
MSGSIEPIRFEDGTLFVLNQLKLPQVIEYNPRGTIKKVFGAIKDMELRGAPLIGISAAYGMYIGIKDIAAGSDAEFMAVMKENGAYLSKARPTAVNLFWAIDKMIAKAESLSGKQLEEKKADLLTEAIRIHQENKQNNRLIGENMLAVLKNPTRLLTHCNAGVLAASEYGMATAAMYLAKEKGWDIKVYVDETRPYLQGARLTAFELSQARIDVVLICDNMAGYLMSQGKVDAVITGADRVAGNGDTANKIGTMSLAVLANYYKVPFYIAAPTSTIDLNIKCGSEIPIEERPAEELTVCGGKKIAPDGIGVYNPAFDVTDHKLITAIVTEKGLVRPSFKENLRKMIAS